ncbi:MAG: hypothetical protein Q4G61_10720 [Tissierellia bacterium]|nr:hypothetical protein [Tissierellia bacterium]
MLDKAITEDITNFDHPQKMSEPIEVAKKGGNIARAAKAILKMKQGNL